MQTYSGAQLPTCATTKSKIRDYDLQWLALISDVIQW